MITEYQTIIGVYDALIDVLSSCENEVLEEFENIYKKYSKDLFTIYNSLESIMDKISHEAYKNIKEKQAYRFQESKGSFLSF